MRKELYLLLTIMFFYSINAQEKYFLLKGSEKIKSVKPVGNWIVATTFDTIQYNNKCLVLDFEGKSKGYTYIGKRDISCYSPSDSPNVIVSLLIGNEETENYGIDSIRAYDLITSNVKWQTTAKGGMYVCSPNSRFLATSHDFWGAQSETLEIIKLEDGSKISLGSDFTNCYTNWLDNERLIIMFNEKSYSNEYQILKNKIIEKNKEFKLHRKNCNDIVKRIKSNLISKEEGMKQIAEGNKKFIGYEDTLSYYSTKMLSMDSKTKWDIRTARFIIYNIKTGQYEKDKELFANNGMKVGVGAFITFELIQVDNNGDVYVFGSLYNEINAIPSIIKIDANGNIIWTQNLLEAIKGDIKKYTYKNELFFTVVRGKEIFVINKTNGAVNSISEIDKNSIIHKLIKPNNLYTKEIGEQLFLKYNSKEIFLQKFEGGLQ